MLKLRSPAAGGARGRMLMSLVKPFAMLAALIALPVVVQANWLSKVVGAAEQAGGRAARHGAGSLDNVAAHVKALPVTSDRAVLAAQATQEGHWRFVNRSGETVTAGTPEELGRVVSILAPEAKAETKLSLYVTEDTLFQHRAALKDLPKGTELTVVVGRESYAVLRQGEGAAERLFAQVRPNLVVELTERQPFNEAVWQLLRPLNKANVRVLALEPGGPSTLSSAPRIDPTTKRAMIDVIDPSSLAAAFGSVRGQTLLATGRAERGLLYVKPSSGPERSLLLKDLFKAAEEADVNLVVMQSASTPRQPGGRNWFWQKVEVKGLDTGLEQARMADFLNALGGSGTRSLVRATPGGNLRAVLDMRPAPDLPRGSATRPLGDVFSNVVSDLTGKVITSSIQANMRSSERQRELDQRVIPFIPSTAQATYLGLFLVGLLGLPLSRAWWRRIWPPEAASDYAGRAGYRAAQAVRIGLFVLLFLPLTAPISAPVALVRGAWDMLTAPWRWWRRLMYRQAATTTS